MDKQILEQIKADLLKRKEQIIKEAADYSQADQRGGLTAKFPEFGDSQDENAQEISEYATNLATEGVLENELRDIDNALDRIAKDNYGICKYCKKEINPKRLLARPTASSCVECKSKLQKGLM